MRRLLGWTVVVLLLPHYLHAQSVRGSASVEVRVFPNAPAFPDQRAATVSPSLAIEPEFVWENGAGNRRFSLTPFLRIDAHDTNRTHVDAREAGALFLGDKWSLFAGVGKVFWGKTEANHLVDIINQTDAVEDIDSEDKLGQPMVNATFELEQGAIDVFFLPYFRERTLAGDRGRLRGPLPFLETATYQSKSERWHSDVAVRGSWFLGDVDLGVSAFRGTSREPRFVPVMVDGADGPTALQPHYDLIDQITIDTQWTRGPTLWKLEALTRGGHRSRFGATTFGVEHTLFNVSPSGADLGLLGEVMLDGRGDEAAPTPFDNDLFVGARLALNDIADTSAVGGPIVDYRSGEVIAFLELQRRFGDRWVAEVEARWLLNTNRAALLHGLRQDDFLTFRLSRYF